jgi:hypothetical protein
MTQGRAHSGTIIRDGDSDFRVVGCRKCRAIMVVLYYRGHRLMADIHAPVLDPVHRLPIEPVEVIPADGDLPEWRSQYEGMTRPSEDPRGTWFGGIDVAEEVDPDPQIAVTCYCQGAHRVDLAAISEAARQWRKSWMPWPVG